MSTTLHALNDDETTFLHEEIFVRRVYMQHGVSLVPPPDDPHANVVVVDCGANVGLFTLFVMQEAARLGVPSVTVVALEPVLPICRVAHANISSALERHPNATVQLLNCAAGGSEEGTAVFSYYADSPGESTRYPHERADQRVLLHAALTRRDDDAAAVAAAAAATTDAPPQTFTCDVRPLSRVFEDTGLTRIDLLKIDVEGDELVALQGVGDSYWPAVRQVVVEVRYFPFLSTRALSAPHPLSPYAGA